MSVPDVFEAIDVFILDQVFQPIADWWQELTGKSNFWIAKSFCWVWMILATTKIVLDFPSLASVSGIFGGLCLLGVIYRVEKKDSEHESGEASFLSHARSFYFWGMFRLIVLASAVYIWSRIIARGVMWDVMDVGLIILILVLYFEGCTPKRPRKMKLGRMVPIES